MNLNSSEWPENLSSYVKKVELSSTFTNIELPKIIDYDIGRTVNFKRISVHHIVLPPGCRTSKPHAESLEEEFVFVIKGRPQLWMNGYIHNLEPNFAVGFPAGTGIAHTVINNTQEEVHLIVAGDITKKDNLCYFPMNPELKNTCQIWWDNPPVHHIGPHNGLSGPVNDTDKAKLPGEYILNCNIQKRGQPFHYPGDNETFCESIRITERIGLKNLGICLDHLPPGTRSSFPHAHTHEDEFAFIIQGNPTVWLDGFVYTTEPNYFAAFPSNTGLAHTINNNTDQEVIFLTIGETHEFPDEKLTYPLNPLREKECRRKGWYWENHQSKVMGSHSAKPTQGPKEHFEFKIATEADSELILDILKTSPIFFMLTQGAPPTLETAKHLISYTPQIHGEDYFKEFLMIFRNNQPIGFIELHANYPEPKICTIGLHVISENLISMGFGKKCYQLIEDYVLRAFRCTKIIIEVTNKIDVIGFWLKMGYNLSSEILEHDQVSKFNQVQKLQKKLEK